MADKDFLDNFYLGLLTDDFVTQGRAKLVVDKIEDHLRTEGIDATIDPKEFLSYIEKLSSLKLLNSLCMGMELTMYKDQIMSQEIKKLFPLAPFARAEAEALKNG